MNERSGYNRKVCFWESMGEGVCGDLWDNCGRVASDACECRCGSFWRDVGESCDSCRVSWMFCFGVSLGSCCVFRHCGGGGGGNEDGLTAMQQYGGKRCCLTRDPVLGVECILVNYCPCFYGCPADGDPAWNEFYDPELDSESNLNPNPNPNPNPASRVIKRILY